MTWTRTRLVGASATFSGLEGECGRLGPDPLTTVLDVLAALPPVDGGHPQLLARLAAYRGRRAAVPDRVNARLVDAVRERLRRWRPLLTDAENALLLTCPLEAVTEVSNIAGTYGCYLKDRKASAVRPLRLRPYRDLARPGGHRVVCGDAEVVTSETSADLIYADPPYTKRQYAAPYHLLNSIATDAEPDPTGRTGLPDRRTHASGWCHRSRAPRALERLAAKSSAPVLALSYSSDGHIPDAAVRDILGTYGAVEVFEFARRRYRSSALRHKGSVVTERRYVMRR